MDNRLLAAKLFGTKAATAAGEEAVIDLQDLAINIFLKFIAVLEGVAIIVAGIVLVKFLKRYFEKVEGWVLSFMQIFRRSVQNVLIPSKYIDPLPARIRHDITLTVAQDQLKNMHPADLADIMEDLDELERMSILQSLPADIMAKTIAELEPNFREQLLGDLKDETVAKVLERLAPDAATDIVEELPKRRMHHLLNIMKTKEAKEIRELLKFKKDTAGSIMNTKFVALKGTLTVAFALDELRKKGEQAEHIYYLYIVDEEGVLKGAISLRDIIFADSEVLLTNLIKRKPVYARLKENIKSIVGKFTKYNLIVIPVIGKTKCLEGVITVDDVLPLLQESKI